MRAITHFLTGLQTRVLCSMHRCSAPNYWPAPTRSRKKTLLNEARKAVVFCCNCRQPNGAWSYRTLPFHQWIDNFHTGYNLECIADYIRFSGEHQYTKYVEKGFDYYIKNFFTTEGICEIL